MSSSSSNEPAPDKANSNLVVEFENAFESCFALMSESNHGQVHDTEEVRTSVDHFVQKYLDSARQLEAYFLNKRLLLSSQRPEQILVEDLNEIRSEIARKDQILNRLNEKIDSWSNLINDINKTNGNANGNNMNVLTSPSASSIVSAANSPSVAMSPAMSLPVRTTPAPSPMQSMHSQRSTPSGSIVVQPPNTNGMMISNDNGPMMPPIHNPPGSFVGSAPNTPIQMQTSTSPGSASLQGPLAYLERTTSNIGMNDNRRSN